MRLQGFLAAVAAPGREVVRVPPFTAYLDRESPLRYLNYAIPDEGAGPADAAALASLRSAFRDRGRLPRFEYLHEHAPDLRGLLSESGMTCELSTPFMAVSRLDRVAPQPTFAPRPIEDRDIALWSDAQARAFGDEPPAMARDPRASGGGACVVEVEGEIAGGAAWSQVALGVSEVRGVFCVDRFRGRGIGGAATAAAAAAAFSAGAELCVLTPGSTDAMRIYARAGFAGVATSEYWADPD